MPRGPSVRRAGRRARWTAAGRSRRSRARPRPAPAPRGRAAGRAGRAAGRPRTPTRRGAIAAAAGSNASGEGCHRAIGRQNISCASAGWSSAQPTETSIASVEHRVEVGARYGHEVRDRSPEVGPPPAEQLVAEVGAAREVAVERRRPHPHPTRHLAEGESGCAVLTDGVERGHDDPLGRASPTVGHLPHARSILLIPLGVKVSGPISGRRPGDAWGRMPPCTTPPVAPYPAPHGKTARRLEWAFLPPHLRAWIERRCGSPVVSAITQNSGFTPGLRLRAGVRGRLAPLRQGRLGQGAAGVRRLLPRGGAQARRPAGDRARAAPAVAPRRRLGGARHGVRRRPCAAPAVAPARARRAARRPGGGRRRAHPTARRSRPRQRGGRLRAAPRRLAGHPRLPDRPRPRPPRRGRGPGPPLRRGRRRRHPRAHRHPLRQRAHRRRRPGAGSATGTGRCAAPRGSTRSPPSSARAARASTSTR